MQHFRCASTLNINEKLELKDFSWIYTMIKAQRYFFQNLWKIEFFTKTGWKNVCHSILITMHLLLSIGSFILFFLKHVFKTKILHLSVWATRAALSYKLYTVYKRVCRRKIFYREVVPKYLKQNRVPSYLGCRSLSFLWKHSITTVFWMVFWNFLEQPPLTALVCSSSAKNDYVVEKTN